MLLLTVLGGLLGKVVQVVHNHILFHGTGTYNTSVSKVRMLWSGWLENNG